MSRRYLIVDRPDRRAMFDPAKLATLLGEDDQFLLPLLELIEDAEAAVRMPGHSGRLPGPRAALPRGARGLWGFTGWPWNGRPETTTVNQTEA
jgi:hypothetical protein